MERQHLKQIKGKNVHNFIEKFRKQALTLNISLDTPGTLMKYISSLHSYLRHSLLLFEPKTHDDPSVKVVHLESMGKYEQDDHPKRVVKTRRRG